MGIPILNERISVDGMFANGPQVAANAGALAGEFVEKIEPAVNLVEYKSRWRIHLPGDGVTAVVGAYLWMPRRVELVQLGGVCWSGTATSSNYIRIDVQRATAPGAALSDVAGARVDLTSNDDKFTNLEASPEVFKAGEVFALRMSPQGSPDVNSKWVGWVEFKEAHKG